MTTKHVSCGKHFFKCEEECKSVTSSSQGVKLPEPIQCTPTDTVLTPLHGSNLVDDIDKSELDRKIEPIWDKIDVAYQAAVTSAIKPPGVRTTEEDWVSAGKRMSHADVAAAQGQWEAFLRAAPEYPDSVLSGRGIVMIGGGLRYSMPAWVAIHMIRRSGCTLPIELFFPVTEFPTVEVEKYFRSIGVTCRRLQMRDQAQTGFSIKIVGILLSRFSEVIFLDSDNVPIRDPSFLFDTPEYSSKGIILWQDYWDSTAAPDLAKVLGLSWMYSTSYESGQMVLNKRMAWKGLLLAHYMNLEWELYYDLLSNYMGKGDKETFAAAFSAVKQPFHTVATAPGSIGINRLRCASETQCSEQFFGNTMTQFDPSGKLLFLHTNLSPKWHVHLPDDFDAGYTRRWQVMEPEHLDFKTYSLANFGEDLEKVIYNILRRLRCAPFFDAYEAQRIRMGDGDQWRGSEPGFHNIIEGVDFVDAYHRGFSGNFERLIHPTSEDSFEHYNTLYIKPHKKEVQSLKGLWKRIRGRH